MITPRYYLVLLCVAAAGSVASARELDSEITVTHQVVPEERAASRLRLLPSLQLQPVNPGRLAMASSLMPTDLTAFVNTLEPAPFASALVRSPWRGYARIGYGPVYNLGASAGYRAVDREDMTVDAFVQFDGNSYTRRYPTVIDGDVSLHRNSGLLGVTSSWRPASMAGAALDASVMVGGSGYNFPIYDMASKTLADTDMSAIWTRLNLGWNSRIGKVDYRVGGEYALLRLADAKAYVHNRGDIDLGAAWRYCEKSAWGVDLRFTFNHSRLSDNKNMIRIEPYYAYASRRFQARIGLAMAFAAGNCPSDNLSPLVCPEVRLSWTPSAHFSLWGKLESRLVDNSRLSFYEEQPYLMADFDAGYSRMRDMSVGFTLGPWKAASISFWGGYASARDWYISAVPTGYMHAVDINGWHFGGSFGYDFRSYLSLGVKAEFAPSAGGNFGRGFAPWRDHARFNLTASAVIRPIAPLDITIAYHLRPRREKILNYGGAVQDLLDINDLGAKVQYRITERWTAFVAGENLLNRSWYRGPGIPCRGIMGMIGCGYKF